MRIAYVLLVHKNPDQVARLVSTIRRPGDVVYINIFRVDSVDEHVWKEAIMAAIMSDSHLDTAGPMRPSASFELLSMLCTGLLAGRTATSSTSADSVIRSGAGTR